MNEFPPWHEFGEQGAPLGPSVEMMRSVAEQAGFELEITEETPFLRCLRMMQQGDVDVMTNLSYSDERAAFMHLIPYAQTDPDAFWMLKDSPYLEKPLAYARTLRLVTLRGSVRTPAIDEVLDVFTRRMIEVESWEQAFDLVGVGRADAVVGPALNGYHIIRKNERFKGRFAATRLEVETVLNYSVHIGLSKRSDNARLLGRLESTIERMRENGEFERWFPRFDRLQDSEAAAPD
jgi:polar amino acid transport system substrate-binding protein